MSEPRPTYEPDPTTVIANAAAAQEWFGRLTAYAAALRQRVEAGNLDADTLKAIAAQARDLRQCAEALAVGLAALLLIFLPALAAPAAAESEPELPALLFILTGQSNAGPKGSGGEAVPGAWLYAPQYSGRAWRQMAPVNGRYSVALPFARAVHEATGRTVLVAQVYSGGTSIVAWQPDAPNTPWRQAMSAVGNTGKPAMYSRVRSLVAEASAAWGGPVELSGVLYVQVERDSKVAYGAMRYEANLRRLIAAWRADYGAGLPVMFIDAHTNMTGGGPVVAAAVRAVAADTPATALIPVRDLPKQDWAHFTSTGVDELGRRFAAAWLGMPR